MDDYYSQSASRRYLRRIEVPVLILHALDDPFLPRAGIPGTGELADAVTLELSRHGGHVGFVSGASPLTAEYWLEQRICRHLRSYLQ